MHTANNVRPSAAAKRLSVPTAFDGAAPSPYGDNGEFRKGGAPSTNDGYGELLDGAAPSTNGDTG
jgi:hypothetical protein